MSGMATDGPAPCFRARLGVQTPFPTWTEMLEPGNHAGVEEDDMTRSTAALGAVLLCTCRPDGRAGADAGTADPGPRDIMPALLQEVRGLRAAMEQMTSAGARVQLALGRLQLQEQRLNAANGRLAEIRVQLAGTQRRAAELQEQAQTWKACCRASVPMPEPRPRYQRRTDSPVLTVEMQSGCSAKAAAANANAAAAARCRKRRWPTTLDRAGPLVGSQSAPRRSRTVAPSP